MTPLKWSALGGHLECLKLLLENNADVDHVGTVSQLSSVRLMMCSLVWFWCP